MFRHASRLAAALATITLALSLHSYPALAQAPSIGTFASGILHPRGLAFDGSGRLYISLRTPTGAIYRCTPPSSAMTVFASGLVDPIEMVFDGAGNLYAANYNNLVAGGAVFKITPAGVKSTFVSLPNPTCLAFAPDGDLFVGRWDGVINKVTPGGVASLYVDVGVPFPATGNKLEALHAEPDGTLYAASLNGEIFKIAPGAASVTLWSANLPECDGLTKAPDGNFYASSYTDQRLWKIGPDGVAVPYAGAAGAANHVDGTLAAARFNLPSGMAYYGGQLWIAEYNNNDVRALYDATPARAGSWGAIKALYR